MDDIVLRIDEALERMRKDIAGWRATDQVKAIIRARFSIEKYVRSEVTAE